MTLDRERTVALLTIERDYYKRLLRDEPHKPGRKHRDAELRRRVWAVNAEKIQDAIDVLVMREAFKRDPSLISHASH